MCCPAPANGTAVCTNGVCNGLCNPGYCPVGGGCVLDTSPGGNCCFPVTCQPGQCGVIPGGDNCGGPLTCGGCPAGEECCSGTCSALDTADACGSCDTVCGMCEGGGPRCNISVDGVRFCGGGGYCFACSMDTECDPGYRCVEAGTECGSGITTVCTVAC